MTEKTENFSVSALNFPPACGILCVTGFNNPVNSGRCLRHGGNLRTTKNATALLAGLRERLRESVSGTTVDVLLTPSQVRLFCTGRNKPGKAVKSSSTGGCNGPCQLSGPVLRSAPGLPHLKSDRRAFAADHPRRGEYRPRRDETASELPACGMRVDESSFARAGRDARSVIQGGAYL